MKVVFFNSQHLVLWKSISRVFIMYQVNSYCCLVIIYLQTQANNLIVGGVLLWSSRRIRIRAANAFVQSIAT